MSSTSSFYAQPSYVSGAGAIFSGARRQRGGSIFGALKSVVAPFISGIGRSLKKNAMTNALGLATDMIGDLATGKNMKASLLNRGKERGLKTLQQTFTGTRQRRKPKRLNAKRKQRGSGKKRPLRKRCTKQKRSSRKRPKTSKKSPSAKRRRLNF